MEAQSLSRMTDELILVFLGLFLGTLLVLGKQG